MAWDYDRSLDRIQHHLDGMGEIEIHKLVREADLESLLSETRCREIYGAHVYAQVTNFPALASDASTGGEDYKRLIQAVHIYQREIGRIVEGSVFDGLRVHFQGAKLHALFYRPIDDGPAVAAQAVLLQLLLKDFVASVFNPAFPRYDDFAIAAGADLGDVIGTRNGVRGDRELLFLGAPANYAAKIVGSAGQLRLTEQLYTALPEDLQALCSEVGDAVHEIDPLTQSEIDALLVDYGVNWDREESLARIEHDQAQFPVSRIVYSSADVLIDLDGLSIFNNKRVTAASVFADVSGFTSYVDEATTAEDQKAALRVFHAVRKEMSRVVKNDFEGVRVQFQGDRIQALFHLPKEDEAAIAAKAVESAIGLQSSMELTLKECLPEAETLQLAIGIDLGTTLVSKLGTRAHRDRICLGTPVERAAACEEQCAGGWTGITRKVLDGLPDDLRGFFHYDATANCYVAKDLTMEKLDRARRALVYEAGRNVYVRTGASGVTIADVELPDARPITPSRPWSDRT